MQQFMAHLSGFENPQTGLLDLPEAAWGLTDYLDTLAGPNRFGQSTALNALYYRTLLSAQIISLTLGDQASADGWGTRAAGVKQAANALLYLPAEGRYLGRIYNGVPLAPTLHAQAWALAAGLEPEGESSRVADALLELISDELSSPNVGVYGMNWVLEGLGNAGYVEEALGIIRSYYGMMLDAGATTWWEHFQALEYPSSSLSHGWGGSPTWFLSEYMLGLRQNSPGVWEARPALEGAAFAEGAIPLKGGPLSLRWERPDCATFRIEISAPAGSTGQIRLPEGKGYKSLDLDGAQFWGGPGEILIPLSAGFHRIRGMTDCNQ